MFNRNTLLVSKYYFKKHISLNSNIAYFAYTYKNDYNIALSVLIRFVDTVHARFMYIPVLVSTKISSPMLTKSGTVTTAPVSTVAGFDPPIHIHHTSSLDIVLKKRFVKHYLLPCAVSPRRPGSTSTTLSVTVFGSSKSITLQKSRQTQRYQHHRFNCEVVTERLKCVYVCYLVLPVEQTAFHSFFEPSRLVTHIRFVETCFFVCALYHEKSYIITTIIV